MILALENAAELVCVARRGERSLRGSALTRYTSSPTAPW